MEQIHNKLLESSKTYASWHNHPHHKKIHWGATIAVAVIVLLLVMNGVQKWRNTAYNFVTVEFSQRSAVLTLDPQTKTVKVGDTFAANVILDTDGKPVDGIDLYSLHYDPTILTVVDDNTTKNGVQITPGTSLDVTAVNSVDPKTGTITFSQASQPGSSFNGKGVLATIHFKATKKGTSALKFDFKIGSTRDTNVAHAGRDQLANVVDGLYTVQ
ncbi:MAG: cohesin domain-containing protein [Patescibacteria group bacterium]